jgi:hypothetical protein
MEERGMVSTPKGSPHPDYRLSHCHNGRPLWGRYLSTRQQSGGASHSPAIERRRFQRLGGTIADNQIHAAKIRINEGSAKEKVVFLLHFRVKVSSAKPEIRINEGIYLVMTVSFIIFATD